MTEEDYSRSTPISDLDLQHRQIEPEWGKDIHPDLRKKLNESSYSLNVDKEGKYIYDKDFLWGLHSYYTRDLRFGNLNAFDCYYCMEWLDFAGDCLRLGYIHTFLTALNRVIVTLEISQSRKGFLRKAMNTFRKEETHEFREPPKKGLFGSQKKTEEGYG